MFLDLDIAVKAAWRTREFVGGRPINLGSTRTEQFFYVKSDGVYEVMASETGRRVCTGGGRPKSVQAYATAPASAFKMFARGHTHPRGPRKFRIEQTPGPEDGAIAKQAARYGKPSYLIARRGCFRIYWNGKSFDLEQIAGRSVGKSKFEDVAQDWMNAPPSSRTCQRFPD